jgi:dTMP kinase
VDGTTERGRLVAFDGCGKSTQAARLAASLGALCTFEPGASALGASIRRLLLGSDHAVSPRAEALLMAADRAEHVDEVVAPALGAGRWVVTDRYSGSTLAYQGGGRRLGNEPLLPVIEFATSGVAPDLSVLLEVPFEVARARLAAVAPDRLERQGPDFHRRVAAAYRELAAADPVGWAVIDGTGSEDAVAAAVAAVVQDRLGAPR